MSEMTRVLSCEENHDWEDFTSFNFIPMSIPDEHTLCTCVKIFKELGLMKKFKMNEDYLVMYII